MLTVSHLHPKKNKNLDVGVSFCRACICINAIQMSVQFFCGKKDEIMIDIDLNKVKKSHGHELILNNIDLSH